MKIAIPECLLKVADLALALGVESYTTLPACWEHQVDEHWLIKVNGHKETIDGIEPAWMMVWFNGWPAGSVHPVLGGVIAAGEIANEDTFIAALDAAILVAVLLGPKRSECGD